ncbi:MAG: guanylate kinase [Alphaproteobacteria bacterium]|nr:guanylate kinase [Alphaproteobacteria bacterium]MBN2780155.1 guanylate kinase [Alphaproteobacteria bacterium]
MKIPILFILSSVSGGGKTTLRRHLLKTFPHLAWSVSATSRPARPGDIEGKDYIFLTKDDFETRIKNGDFLEYAIVHGGSSAKYYGTLKSSIDKFISDGKSVLCEIDVQGFYQIKKNYSGKVVSVFIQPPSLDIIRQRLIHRGDNSLLQIEERLETAKEELKHMKAYDHIILNDDLSKAKEDIVALFRKYL